jgi:C4-dicarboxylate transporter DctM subunit
MTPPYGINLFVASAISRESIEDISRAIVPFILVMLLCLMLITYVPSLSVGLVDLIRR